MHGPGIGYYLFNISVELYIHFARENPDKNFAYSPFSIATALSMLLAGAYGNTAEELSKVLHVAPSQGNVDMFYEALNDLSTDKVTLRIVNRLYSERQYPVWTEYAYLLEDYYGASIKSVDFKKNAEAIRREANKWVSEKTESKIPNLLERGSINSKTMFIVISAIYFEAAWMSPFRATETRPADFYLDRKNVRKVDMMRQKSYFEVAYSDDLKCGALEMPYNGGEYSMVILLPDNLDGLSFLEERITEHSLESLLDSLKVGQEVLLQIPKFKIGSKMQVQDVLEALGVHDLFDPSMADLSEMFKNENPAVSSIVHQALVEVDENGTVAAAATAVLGNKYSRPNRELILFLVDHPFMFLIRKKEGNLVLFMGSVHNPG